jgi:hypothetical protein
VRAVDNLADATGEDAGALNEALDALERGSTLTADQAGLLSVVVSKLSPETIHPVEVPVDAEPDPDVKAALDMLRARIDMAYKAL